MKKIIYYNGDILTMEDTNLYVEAILVEDGLIKKIGNKEEILRFKDNETEIIDLEGKTLMPSFIDAHSHISGFATGLAFANLDKCRSFQDIINTLNKFKEESELAPEDWIVGFGYDNNNLKEKKNPTKEVLDKVSKDHVIFISHISGHNGSTNSKGLEYFGITKDTKDPVGGKYGRELESNEPNGYLEEAAYRKCSLKVKRPSLKQMEDLFKKAEKIYESYGITTAQDGFIRDTEFKILKHMSDVKNIEMDIIGYIDLADSKHIYYDNKDFVNKYINRFKIGGFKIFLDGSPQERTAYLTKPYEGERTYRGYPNYPGEKVVELVEEALDCKEQLLAHTNGDAAADQYLDAFKKAIKSEKYNDIYRPVMIHSQIVREDQVADMKKINMIPSYFVAHTYFWGDVHIKNLGKERAFKISPVKTTVNLGEITYTLHQDTPVILPDMVFTIWCAVNRITKSGVIIGPDERVTTIEALKAVTINAAYQYFEENIKGSIKEGKLADLIILDKNPLKVDKMDIKDIKVIETIKEGKVLYKKVSN